MGVSAWIRDLIPHRGRERFRLDQRRDPSCRLPRSRVRALSPQAARGKEPPGGLPTSAGTGSLAWRWRCSARLRSRPGGGGEALVPRVLLLRGSDRFGAGFVFRGDTLLRRRSRVTCPEMAGGAGAAAAWRFSVAPGNTRGEHEAGFLQQLLVALVHSEITGYNPRAEFMARNFLLLHILMVFQGRGVRVRT